MINIVICMQVRQVSCDQSGYLEVLVKLAQVTDNIIQIFISSKHVEMRLFPVEKAMNNSGAYVYRM